MLTRLGRQWLVVIKIAEALVAAPVVLRAIPESREATGEPPTFRGPPLDRRSSPH